MDNLGRDVERMMWTLVIGAFLAGAAAVWLVIWVVQRLRS